MSPELAAQRLGEIALLLEVRGENPYKARAFTSAARTLQSLETDDIGPLVRTRAIADLPGIGATTFAVLADLVDTGDSAYLDALREATPEGLVEMLRIPGLGPARVHKLHVGLGLESVADLEAAAHDGRLAALPGFGPRTAARILRGIAALRETSGHTLHSLALAEAERLIRAVANLPGVTQVLVAGALRRCAEVVREIDLVVGCSASVSDVATAAARIAGVEAVVAGSGPAPTLRLVNGMRATLRCTPDDRLNVALWRATGSSEHCDAIVERLRERGFNLRDDRLLDQSGTSLPVADEAAIYRAAGLPFIAPELREARGEIEAAAAGRLPALLEHSDLRGALHCHSDYSDGTHTIRQMALAAQARGWEYLGISDHSQSAAYAGGLDRDKVLRQHEEIDRVNDEVRGVRILKGIEADILADGQMDFADDALERFDYVIASVHSRFSMDESQMTARILRAMEDPRVTILGHPTGRLLLAREPYPLDVDAVIGRAAETGVAIELNCDPHRLDLDWRWLMVARERGATVELGPDAHSPDGLDYLKFGVRIARKGWLEAPQVLNARSADEVLRFARARRHSTGALSAAHGS